MSLQERLSQYKNTELCNVLTLTLRLNKPYQDYLNSLEPNSKDPDNLWGLKQYRIGRELVEDLYNTKLFSFESIALYKTRLVIVLQDPELVTEILTKLASETRFALTTHFNHPLIEQECWDLPPSEVLPFKRMWQMIWVAHRNRLLGQLHFNIPAHNKANSHVEIAEELLKTDPIVSKFQTIESAIDILYHPALKYGIWYDGKEWYDSRI